MNRKTWSGNFSARTRGAHDNGWIISAAGAPRIDVYLSGVELPPDLPSTTLAAVTIERIDIEWRNGGTRVFLTQAGAVRPLQARTAFVHEPKPDLYQALPLETYGARARTFWNRIFLLVRIPGGPRLLNFIARRARA